ncbi:hypothetical protein N0V90_012750 [Kalmusia sp. IMI 367209]|nr:hypothetical protein N0V90_012750 [Kalmusia sp. IMI 367209]
MAIHAGVVKAWGDAPVYDSIDLPAPSESQVRVKVLGAGVHTFVRSRASGQHFSMAGKNPPHVPGTDGVGIIPETNQLVYFNALLSPTGSIAQEINVGKRDIFPLPEGADVDTIAVLVNPAMSSWMALTARAGVQAGSGIKIAIVGATGVSGQAAVQISKAFGASEIVTIGKPGDKLEKTKELGATAVIPLVTEKLTETDFSAAADVDVVLDYLWGDVSQAALAGIIKARKNPSQRLTWVEIGSLAGETQSVPASLLRQANVALLGCAPGSWTFPELYGQTPAMLDAIVKGGLKAEYAVKKLEDVESWWNETSGARPLVKP